LYNVQLAIFDPGLYGNQIFTANGPAYRVRGVEGDLIMKATEHLTVMSSFAWNSSSQQTAPTLAGNSGVPVSLFSDQWAWQYTGAIAPFQGNIRIATTFPSSNTQATGR